MSNDSAICAGAAGFKNSVCVYILLVIRHSLIQVLVKKSGVCELEHTIFNSARRYLLRHDEKYTQHLDNLSLLPEIKQSDISIEMTSEQKTHSPA